MYCTKYISILLSLSIAYLGPLRGPSTGRVQFHVSFRLGEPHQYQVIRDVVRTKIHAVPLTYSVNCIQQRRGDAEILVTEVPSLGITRDPLRSQAWVTSKGVSKHRIAFWLTFCPERAVRISECWQGTPPTLAESIGVRPTSLFTYKLKSIERRGSSEIATVSLSCIQQASSREPLETRFSGEMTLFNETGQLVDLTLTRSELRRNHPLEKTYIFRLKRI